MAKVKLKLNYSVWIPGLGQFEPSKVYEIKDSDLEVYENLGLFEVVKKRKQKGR